MKSNASTPEGYIDSLPEDRRNAIKEVRKVILKNLPKGYEEAMNWGMITYQIPLATYPITYNKQPLMYAALGSQKNYMAVYLMGLYANSKEEKWFEEEYIKTGKKLNKGKSCVKFTKLENLPLDLIGKAVAKTSVEEYIKIYEESRKR
ncbi:DUF1801 domain-containing protein [Candidatus Dojkabacteria bacterium]|uniref:DUF1801 domain-containing protein n=1 Tax=Candidatus Dojkabacteria bacterium TaxID=2099670 RepID=A0A955L2E8_9BACT|nr:DUF1801 domain-containing protein [Candidatus Dojkabacteria bacterium]